jgi:diaminopimelate decarboxylase
MTQPKEGANPRISQLGYTYTQDLADIPPEPAGTPFLHPMPRTLDALFEATAATLAGRPGPAVSVSIACNGPIGSEDLILTRASQDRFVAACTNQREQQRAERLAIPGSRIVMSGPAKYWPGGMLKAGNLALFCDSLPELEAVAGQIKNGPAVAEHVGITLRMPEVPSRFGFPVSIPDGLETLCSRLAELPATQKLCLEFRADSGRTGVARWGHVARRFLDMVGQIEARIGRPIVCLSLGGHWCSEDWIFALEGPIKDLSAKIAETLPAVSLLIVDAGQAFAQPAHSLITRVLEVRGDPLLEVVVDASIAELTDAEHVPHRISWRSSQDMTWRSVWLGQGSILGRSSSEADILAHWIEIPEGLVAGDLLAFCDAGGQCPALELGLGT